MVAYLNRCESGQMNIVLLPPLYLPPAEYFQLMKEADMAVIDTALRYRKNMKAVHRTVVSGPTGNAFLTVPVSTPGSSKCSWNEVTVSPHGEWWRIHKTTLETLYGPTPYYHLYKHDLNPIIDAAAVGHPITDLNIGLVVAIRKLSGIITPLSVTLDPRYIEDKKVKITDFRNHDFYASESARSVLEDLFQHGRSL